MKNFIFCFVTFFIIGCSTNININTRRIRSNSKFRDGFTISKIIVDSFTNNGIPYKYKVDSNFHCNTVLNFEPREFIPFIKLNAKHEFINLNETLDSLKLFDRETFRNEDTINIYGTRYIPKGIKKSRYYYEILEKIELLKFTKSNFKYKSRVYFTKPNAFYNWTASNPKNNIRKKIPYFIFEKNNWYKINLEANYGLLMSGRKTIFLYSDSQKRLNKMETDEIYDGPF